MHKIVNLESLGNYSEDTTPLDLEELRIVKICFEIHENDNTGSARLIERL